MNIAMQRVLIGVVTLCWSVSAFAWGPTTDISIVSTATHVISRDMGMKLTTFISYVQEETRAYLGGH